MVYNLRMAVKRLLRISYFMMLAVIGALVRIPFKPVPFTASRFRRAGRADNRRHGRRIFTACICGFRHSRRSRIHCRRRICLRIGTDFRLRHRSDYGRIRRGRHLASVRHFEAWEHISFRHCRVDRNLYYRRDISSADFHAVSVLPRCGGIQNIASFAAYVCGARNHHSHNRVDFAESKNNDWTLSSGKV